MSEFSVFLGWVFWSIAFIGVRVYLLRKEKEKKCNSEQSENDMDKRYMVKAC
jgi:cbb3-type cytochrome oxidase subunit 3